MSQSVEKLQDIQFQIEKPCYFFAVKWEFYKMGIFAKMLTGWVKMGSHFIANVLYVYRWGNTATESTTIPAFRISYNLLSVR